MTPKLEAAVVRALEEERFSIMPRLLRPLHPADQADLIERLDADDRAALIEAMGAALDPEVLVYLDETVREEILSHLDEAQIVRFLSVLDSDDAVDLIGDLGGDPYGLGLVAIEGEYHDIELAAGEDGGEFVGAGSGVDGELEPCGGLLELAAGIGVVPEAQHPRRTRSAGGQVSLKGALAALGGGGAEGVVR